jgi:SAM-dependent methyltransferase
MNFSPGWDQTYRESRQLSTWPWSDLVSFTLRHARPDDGFRRVLELGCGAGANIPFFRKLGVDYWAIEGSAFVVAKLHEAFPDLGDRIVAGDFTREISFDGPFDLVIDRSSLTHNDTDAIRRTLRMVGSLMRPGAKFIGINWFSTKHSAAAAGDPMDPHTRTNIPAGQFAGVGAVHFSDQEHIVDLIGTAGFSLERLEHQEIDGVLPTGGSTLGWWNFVAVKP